MSSTLVKTFLSLAILAILCADFSVAIKIEQTTLDELDQIKEKAMAEIYFHDKPIDNATKAMFENFERLYLVKQLYTIKVESNDPSRTYTEKFDDEATLANGVNWKLTGSKLPVLVMMENGTVVKVHEDMKQLESRAASAVTDAITKFKNLKKGPAGETKPNPKKAA
ncbi:hypothetical protein Ddc_17574 [Ditylenchus destructor]|nr:hypothetical protein Ddc_17574 [Ditylenchus destructor]